MKDYTRYLDLLVSQITAKWPLAREESYRHQIARWRAFRSSDKDMLRPVGWSEDKDRGREYSIDPLGERIPWVWSDLLFGQDPVIAPAKKPDQKRMDELINSNCLPSRLQRAEWVCSSEGEVWWRIVPNFFKEHADIQWHSRMTVAPLWIGEELMAAAFVSVLAREGQQGKDIIYYVEVHCPGAVRRMLFKGRENSVGLGTEIPLSERVETADVERDWEHGLDILCGRIYNKLGANYEIGISDFDGIEDLMLALNELTSIGQENARLTAKQRAIIPQRFLDMQGNFPRGAEILIATEVDADPEKIKNEVAMVEFSFDAASLIAYTEHLTDRILTRARVAPQLVGRHTEGAQTGPALRARVLDSILAQQGKGKIWDDEAPEILQLASQVEALTVAQGGLGISWSSTELPSFKRSNALPEDPEALSRRLAIEVNAEFLSRKTAIQMSHPEWDGSRVDEEVKQIMQEVGHDVAPPAVAPSLGLVNQDATSTTNAPETSATTQERSNGGVHA